MSDNCVKLLFAGDFCSSNPEEIIVSTEIKELIETCNIKCLNFEGPLAKGKSNSPNNKYLNQSDNSPIWCEENGFNLISLANNHAYDYGCEGLLHTMSVFKKATTIGAGNWLETYSLKTIEVNGIKIGFFSATSNDFAALKDKWTDKEKLGCAWINHPEVNNLIRESKNKCDFLFIISHGGVEYMDIPLPEWRDRYRELIEIGADGVIASHPHVPQGVEEYKGKPIFYSLGNFYFDKEFRPMYWDNGLIAILEIKKNNITYSTMSTVRKKNNISIDLSKETENHIKYINEILTNDDLYLSKVNKEVLMFYNKYSSWLLLGFNAREMNFNLKNIFQIVRSLLFSKPNLKIALHQLREESTYWTLIRALKIKTKTIL